MESMDVRDSCGNEQNEMRRDGRKCSLSSRCRGERLRCDCEREARLDFSAVCKQQAQSTISQRSPPPL